MRTMYKVLLDVWYNKTKMANKATFPKIDETETIAKTLNFGMFQTVEEAEKAAKDCLESSLTKCFTASKMTEVRNLGDIVVLYTNARNAKETDLKYALSVESVKIAESKDVWDVVNDAYDELDAQKIRSKWQK